MRVPLALTAVLVSGAAPAADPVSLPAGAVAYAPARVTQSISVLNDRDHIEAVAIAALEDTRWHQPGGLGGVDRSLYRSETYRTLPAQGRVRTWVGDIGVKNSFGFVQQNRGIRRAYPVGTRFDEVLVNAKTGKAFEQRTREKAADGWLSTVAFADEEERPAGYTGLKVSCSSCHNEAGTGKYAAGLVPGGDTVLSDPLDWSVWASAPGEGWTTQPEPGPQPAPAPKAAPTPVQYVMVRDGLFRSHWVAVTARPTVTVTPAGPAPGTAPSCSNGSCGVPQRRGLFRR
ncbi:hypothetical protein [Frigoriglobus tundricola]|uniref:Cytochrome P460 domain-containing protein n=1 Tax=Frigoriglobus tundricola TaxID=2774151 RepID=A0A6M5YZR3_9BACT|nr:hypothetical protein [Frigoriglobus tundricola]QJW98723.1 hypothetical protein FTUN_6318 [Frigoriglobus tundricola]